MSDLAESPSWRSAVDASLQELRDHCEANAQQIGTAAETIKKLAADIGAALTIHAANAQQLANNTQITIDVSGKLDALNTRISPVLEVTETMGKGAAVFGKVFAFFERWGTRIVRVLVFFGALWLAARLLMSGAGWTEAIRIFIGIQGK